MRFVPVLDYLRVKSFNTTCTFPDDEADPILSHPTRQGTYAVLDENDDLVGVCCTPHYERWSAS